jgi:hypothetical protein
LTSKRAFVFLSRMCELERGSNVRFLGPNYRFAPDCAAVLTNSIFTNLIQL